MIYKVLRYGLTSLLGLTVFLFWLFCHPEALSFHEQNQMFLFSWDYFCERITVAGCLSDYVSEFLVQFYYYPACGAAILAVLFLLLQALTYQIFKSFTNNTQKWSTLLLSFLPVLLLWTVMGDENTLLSFPVAILFSLITYLLCRRMPWWVQGLCSFALYWLVGPAFIITLTFFVIRQWKRRADVTIAPLRALVLITAAVLWVFHCRTLWMAQFPWDTVLAGINYHRFTLMLMAIPATFYLTVFLWAISPLLLITTRKWLKVKDEYFAAALLLIAVVYSFCIDNPFDPNTYSILKQQYQVRKGDWIGIINDAKQNSNAGLAAAQDPISCTAVNLALAKTGQLSEHMFELPQMGVKGLLFPWRRENVSCVTTMEAFYQLGFINESMRYAFDLQECIGNCRKSCRFTQRLAECNIINGRYDVASKYIDRLKQTLFYSHWAKQAETYLYDEVKVMNHPLWNQLRQYRLENDFLYDYPEMDRMLGQLVLRNRNNQLAFDYFMAALLLEGNFQSYLVNLPEQPKANEDPYPKGYREYYEYMQKQVENGNPDVVSGATSTR